jgi:phage-related protein
VARVIGEAKIRLSIEGAGLGAAIKREIKQASREAFSGGIFDDADKEADATSKRVGSRFTSMFGKLTSLGKSFGSVLASGAKLASIGAAAGAGLAGITSLTTGVIGLIGVLGNAAGVAGLLPAAFAGFLAVSTTIKLGTQGISESFKALASGDVAKFNESLKGLAPSAQEFVKSIKGIKPEFDKMQLQVQQNLFDGLGKGVQNLATRYLPVARDLFGSLATTINAAGKEAISFADDGETVGQVSLLVDSLKSSFANLVPAVKPVLSAFLDIGQVGGSFLPQITAGVSGLAIKFGDFIRTAASSGALSDFFQTAIDTVKQLGTVLKNVFGIFRGVFEAAQASGGGFLNNLVEITGQIKEFVNSAQGMTALTTFFSSMKAVVAAVLPVFLQLAQVVGTTLVPIIANLATTIGPALVPVVQALGVALQAAAPGIAALGQGFAALIQGIAPALPAIGQLAAVLGQGLGQVMATLGPVIGQFAQVLAGVLAQAIPPLIPIITSLVQIIGQILTAVAPLIPPIVQLAAAALGPLLTIIQALIPPFQLLINNVLKAIQPILPVIANAFAQLGAALAPLAGALGQAVVQIFSALLPVLNPLITAILAIVQAVIPLIPPLITIIQTLAPIIALFAQLTATIIGFIASAITPLANAFGVVASVIAGAMNVVLSVISGVVNTVTAIFSGLLTIVSSIWNTISSTITGIVGRIGSFISSGFQGFVNTVKTAFTNIVNAVSSGVSSAVSFVAQLPGKILSAVGNFASLLFNAGRDLLQGLINGITGMVKGVIDKVVSVGKSILSGIKGALGISSPSKEMAKIGVFIGEGLIKGIDKITPAVNNAASALANGVTDTMGAPLNMAFATNPTGASGNNLTAIPGTGMIQNNYMLPGTDVKQFADTVLRRANTDLLSGASTFSVQRQGVQDGVNDQHLTGVAL